jgi:hypothetical protein
MALVVAQPSLAGSTQEGRCRCSGRRDAAVGSGRPHPRRALLPQLAAAQSAIVIIDRHLLGFESMILILHDVRRRASASNRTPSPRRLRRRIHSHGVFLASAPTGAAARRARSRAERRTFCGPGPDTSTPRYPRRVPGTLSAADRGCLRMVRTARRVDDRRRRVGGVLRAHPRVVDASAHGKRRSGRHGRSVSARGDGRGHVGRRSGTRKTAAGGGGATGGQRSGCASIRRTAGGAWRSGRGHARAQ